MDQAAGWQEAWPMAELPLKIPDYKSPVDDPDSHYTDHRVPPQKDTSPRDSLGRARILGPCWPRAGSSLPQSHSASGVPSLGTC